MRVVCVDGNESELNRVVGLCAEHPAVDEVTGANSAEEALALLAAERVDLALLTVELPGMGGLALAAGLRKIRPSLAIVFLAEDERYAFAAYAARPQNYLVKPLDREKLGEEIDYYILSRSRRDISHIEVRTFGNFEITVDGSALGFKRVKAKELLALLVDMNGTGISRRQAFTEMWENREYDKKGQKLFDVVFSSLKHTLREYGISEILEMKSGLMRIRPDLIDCDRYRYAMGDDEAISAYQGIYMYGYSWARWNGSNYD